MANHVSFHVLRDRLAGGRYLGQRSCPFLSVVTHGRLTHTQTYKHNHTHIHTHRETPSRPWRRGAEMIRAEKSSSSVLLALRLQCLYRKHEERDGPPPSPLARSVPSLCGPSPSFALCRLFLTCPAAAHTPHSTAEHRTGRRKRRLCGTALSYRWRGQKNGERINTLATHQLKKYLALKELLKD